MTTDYRILPEEWDASGRRLRIPYGRSQRSDQLTDIEGAMQRDLSRMETVIGNLELEGRYTIDGIMDRYRAMMSSGTLGAFAEKLAVEFDRSGNIRTARAYRTAVTRLRGFVGGREIYPEQITPTLVADFQNALKTEGRSPNTISFYMRILRAIYHKAIADGRLTRRPESPFAGVFTGLASTRKRALTHTELAILSSFDSTAAANEKGPRRLPEPLDRALAMFLFCYHARGMCFVDMAGLKKSDLAGDTIRYRRHKTGQAIELRVLPAMRRIIDWLAPETADSDYLFPVVTDPSRDFDSQYESGLRLQNIHLKRIASMCGITRSISTHSARHSWATVAKNAGLPLAVISEGLGHTNQRTTEIYLASLEQSLLDHAARVVSDAIGDKTVSRCQARRAANSSMSLSIVSHEVTKRASPADSFHI